LKHIVIEGPSHLCLHGRRTIALQMQFFFSSQQRRHLFDANDAVLEKEVLSLNTQSSESSGSWVHSKVLSMLTSSSGRSTTRGWHPSFHADSFVPFSREVFNVRTRAHTSVLVVQIRSITFPKGSHKTNGFTSLLGSRLFMEERYRKTWWQRQGC
jgi:hypothetical protein